MAKCAFSSDCPRRVFDARYDYDTRRGSLGQEAERVITLRLVDGIPKHYLILTGLNYRGESTDYDRSEPMVRLWYQFIEGMVKDKHLMSELKLKADFLRDLWNKLPESQRKGQTRNEWVGRYLAKDEHEQAQMVQQGGSDESAFKTNCMGRSVFRQAAEQTYFKITQPEAAEQMRKRAAEMAVGEPALETTERDSQKMQDETGPIFAKKGLTPIVWDWEKD